MTIQPHTAPVGHYRSYLVRFWQSNEEGCWRASAQSVQTGGTMLFGDVASLLAFLQAEVGDNFCEETKAVSNRALLNPTTQNE
jgi:hypothetical protein